MSGSISRRSILHRTLYSGCALAGPKLQYQAARSPRTMIDAAVAQVTLSFMAKMMGSSCNRRRWLSIKILEIQ